MQKEATDAGVPIGQRDTPVPDRKVLENIHTLPSGKKIGERSQVRLVVFINGAKATGAKHSDGTAGEGVNCKQAGPDLNDIHIDIGPKQTTKACAGVVAEMIPHYRPVSWTPANLQKLGATPVRMTGQLFLDSRHNLSTCAHPSPGDPPRISLWEIHPVYALDVCKATNISKCVVSNDSVWVPFDKWVSSGAAKAAQPPAPPPIRRHMKHE
jgi:hypothetical protein